MKIQSPTFTREGEKLRSIGRVLDLDAPPKYKVLAIKDIYKNWCEELKKDYQNAWDSIKSNIDKSK
jgi:hypothetical protein